MVIDVMSEIYSIFLRLLGIRSNFLTKTFCIAFRKCFRFFYRRVSTNRSPSLCSHYQFFDFEYEDKFCCSPKASLDEMEPISV